MGSTEPLIDIERTRDKYHRAIWAADVLEGQSAANTRWDLVRHWDRFVLACHADVDGSPSEAVQNLVNDLHNTREKLEHMCGASITKAEKYKGRKDFEKQRDFIVGSCRRVLHALKAVDTRGLHFYREEHELFTVNEQSLPDPVFGIGYYLWLGVRKELKMTLTLALYRNKDYERPMLRKLTQCIQGLLHAMEYGDPSKLEFYKPHKSPLHLSNEQDNKQLWEGVIYDLTKICELFERAES